MYDNNVWFCDLQNAILAFVAKCPDILLFSKIEGTPTGDFIIICDKEIYVVKHTDFTVWHRITLDVWERL